MRKDLVVSLRGLNFADHSIREILTLSRNGLFRNTIRKNREIKDRREICNGPSAKLIPHKIFFEK